MLGIRDAHSLQPCQSLLCDSNLSDAQKGALLHLREWCHLSLVYLLKSRLCFVTLPDVCCVLFYFILDLFCDWWGLRKWYCIGNTETSSSTLVRTLIYHLWLPPSSYGSAHMVIQMYLSMVLLLVTATAAAVWILSFFCHTSPLWSCYTVDNSVRSSLKLKREHLCFRGTKIS